MIKKYRNIDHDVVTIPGIFYHSKGPHGGHLKLFGSVVYGWNDNSHFGWDVKRFWNFLGLVSLHHQDDRGGTLKSMKTGWFLHFYTIKITRVSRGDFHINLRKANLYGMR